MPQQKALLLEKKQGNWIIGDRDIPQPGPGEVLVKIHATALNPVDWKTQRIALSLITTYPAVLGSDAAGTIEEIGEGVDQFVKGDRVFHQGFFSNNNATFQQYTLVPAEIVAKIPPQISFEEAASIPLGLATAALGLYGKNGSAGLIPPWEDGGRDKYKDKPIVIVGGSTSVGQYVIQLVKLSGFAPIIVTASQHNAAHLSALGATHVLGRDVDLAEEAARITDGAPVEVVYDAVSVEATQKAAWAVLGHGGQLVLTLPAVPGVGGVADAGQRVTQVFGNVHPLDNRETGRSLYSKLTQLLDEEVLKPNRIEVLPDGLHGIIRGLERMAKDEVSGVKLIARPQETV